MLGRGFVGHYFCVMGLKIKDKPSIYFNAKEVERVQAYVDTLGDDSGVSNMAKLVIHLLDTQGTGTPTEATPVSDTPEYKSLKADFDESIKVNHELLDKITQLKADLAKATGMKAAPPGAKPATKPTAKPADKKAETPTEKKVEKKSSSLHWMFGSDDDE